MELGHAIHEARSRAGLTQEQLAAKVHVTRQAVSRWENGESEPSADASKLLACVLGVPVANRNRAANLRRSVLYVCPTCANISWSAGEMAVSCCGNELEPLAARKSAGTIEATVEQVDGCQRVYIRHDMSKHDHLLFIAAIGDDLVRIKRLYPEQEARAEFPLQGRCRIYAYGSVCGLVELS